MIREVYRRPGVDALPEHLEHHYGIHITGTVRLDAGVVRIDREGGPPWVARLFVSSRPSERTEGDAEVLRFLERHGFPAERCAHPEPVASFGAGAVLVTEHVEGKAVRNTPANRRRVGDSLGRLHGLATEAGATERPAGSLHHLPQFEGPPKQDLLAADALLTDVEGRLPPKLQPTYDSLRLLLPRGDDGEGLPEAFIHPDPARSNLIATPDGVVFVDWSGAGTGPRLASLAVVLASVGPQQVDEVLAGYAKHARLTAEELERIEGVLWVRALWLACWQCWLAAVSKRVDRAFVPDGQRIAAAAAAVRAAC